jgi:hypothetical protein
MKAQVQLIRVVLWIHWKRNLPQFNINTGLKIWRKKTHTRKKGAL